MGFKSGAYAKVWEVQPKNDRVTQARISISRKNQDGEFIQSFGRYVSFIGTGCASKAARLKKGDTIRLCDIDVTENEKGEKKYDNFVVFSYYMDGDPEFTGQWKNGPQTGGSSSASAKKPTAKAVDDGEIDDSRLPF